MRQKPTATRGQLVARGEAGIAIDPDLLDPAGGAPFRSDPPEVAFGDLALKVSRRLSSSARLDVSATGGEDAVRIGRFAGVPGLDYRWRTHTASARVRALQGEGDAR